MFQEHVREMTGGYRQHSFYKYWPRRLNVSIQVPCEYDFLKAKIEQPKIHSQKARENPDGSLTFRLFHSKKHLGSYHLLMKKQRAISLTLLHFHEKKTEVD